MIIKDIIGSERAISALDGEKVNSLIVDSLKSNNQVVLDFSGINITITAFLNSSIGKLYSQFSSDTIKSLLRIENLNNDDLELLKLVIDKAKLRFGVD